MNQPSSDKNNSRPSRPWRHFFAGFLGVANVSTAVPPAASEPEFRGPKIEHTGDMLKEIDTAPVSTDVLANTQESTRDNVSTVLQTPEEKPEQKIVNMLNRFRKKGIALDAEQDEFFTLCHKHFLGDNMIVSGNFEANIKPIIRYLPRIGSGLNDLKKLFGIKV